MEVIIMINYVKLGCHSGRRLSSVTLKYSHSPHIYSVLTAENVCILEKTYFKLEAHISQRLLPHCQTLSER